MKRSFLKAAQVIAGGIHIFGLVSYGCTPSVLAWHWAAGPSLCHGAIFQVLGDVDSPIIPVMSLGGTVYYGGLTVRIRFFIYIYAVRIWFYIKPGGGWRPHAVRI